MKKTLAILMVVALVATAAFADVSIGAWGRGFAVPIASNGDDTKAGQNVSWGGNGWGAPRIGFTISGAADNVGFQADLNADVSAHGTGDEQKIWVKPFDMLKLSLGRVQDNTLRGDVCFGMFNWLRSGAGTLGEDFTFTRLGNGAGGQVEGLIAALTPVDGLFIGAAVPLTVAYGAGEAADAYKNIQVQAGYTIDGIGVIKAQFIGSYTAKVEKAAADATYGWKDDDDDPATAATWQQLSPATPKETTDAVSRNAIEVAFDLKAVENLNLTVGFHYNMAAEEDRYDQNAANPEALINSMVPLFKVALGGAYALDAANLHFLAALNSYSFDGFSGMRIDGGIGADYALEGITLVADVRAQLYTGSDFKDGFDSYDKGTTSISFLLGVEKGLGNGLVGIGFEGATNGTAIASLQPAKVDSFAFAVPIRFEYWF